MLKTGNPQLEDGYIRIANELFGAILRYPFTAGQMRVALCVMLKTYGWNRKQSPVTARAIADLTGLDLRYVKKVLNVLVSDKVITKEKNANSNILGINKHYTRWRLWITPACPARETPPETSADTCKGPLADTQKGVLKDTHKRQERHIKDSSKDSGVDMLTTAFRRYLRFPMHIKHILSKREKP